MNITAEKAKRKSIHRLAGLVVMICVLFFGGKATVSYASDVRTIMDAKVRSEASTSSSQVGSAPQGTTLTVLGETQGADGNTWYQVEVGGQTGYIRSDLTESAEGSESSGSVAQTDITAGTIGGSSATVRQGPSTSAGKATSAEAGSTVAITGESLGDDGSTWYQVEVNGQSGYIRADLFDENSFARDGGAESPAEGEGGDDAAQAPEEGGEQEPEAGGGSTEIVNVVSSKNIPDDVDIEDMEIDPDILAGWSSDRDYLLRTKDKDGNRTWYFYDGEKSQVSKVDLSGGSSGDSGISSLMEGSGKFIVIGAGVVFLILIVVCVMLAVKLRGYQEEGGGYTAGNFKSSRRYHDDDDDDEYDDDDYDEEDDEEYDEEEYDEEEYGDEEEYDDGYEDDDDYEEEEEEEERPVGKRRWSPKNFLSRRDEEAYEEEEYDDEEYDDDEYDDDEEYMDDDDFEFEFLNMDE